MDLLRGTEVKTVFGNETLDPEDMDLWDKSLEFLKNEEPEKALVAMCLMRKHTSKTMFNMSEIYRKLGSYEDALKAIRFALYLDPFLAIAYYKRGNLHYDMKRFVSALRDFELAELAMHGNSYIDYEQMGMIARLYQAEARIRVPTDGHEFLFCPRVIM
ncbi:hypothetical protein LSH36_314g00010 [Paralvinella palmiformis]|uniref:Tetratricopeptide repeat protein n=1 Tax=Paralvinella palmiformis TaxID=53620 RepID=A0AAD9JGV5_9ANNE|nr:hypothetical protein LSH36_314g00010 [Paralvinella palmiformis]